MSEHPTGASMSPHEIRNTHFSTRIRGYDVDEVDAFCETVAARVQRQSEETMAARDEIERLRGLVDNEDVKERAVTLFSQAQTVADQLIAEAVEHARDLMLAARVQQREVIGHVRETAQNLHDRAAAVPQHDGDDAELGHVQTYAQIAAVQLRAVIDALGEQVDRLDQASEGAQTEVPTSRSPQQQSDDLASPGPAAGAYPDDPRDDPRDELTRPRDLPDPDSVTEPIWASMMPAQTAREPGW